jgi:hypothetical protein
VIVLEDVAAYSATHLATPALSQAWAGLAELLARGAELTGCCGQRAAASGRDLAADGQLAAGTRELRKAVAEVAVHPAGSDGWWLAVRDAATAGEEQCIRLLRILRGETPCSPR